MLPQRLELEACAMFADPPVYETERSTPGGEDAVQNSLIDCSFLSHVTKLGSLYDLRRSPALQDPACIFR